MKRISETAHSQKSNWVTGSQRSTLSYLLCNYIYMVWPTAWFRLCSCLAWLSRQHALLIMKFMRGLLFLYYPPITTRPYQRTSHCHSHLWISVRACVLPSSLDTICMQVCPVGGIQIQDHVKYKTMWSCIPWINQQTMVNRSCMIFSYIMISESHHNNCGPLYNLSLCLQPGLHIWMIQSGCPSLPKCWRKACMEDLVTCLDMVWWWDIITIGQRPNVPKHQGQSLNYWLCP